MMAPETDIIEFEKGWAAMEKGIAKVKLILEELAYTQFSSSEYIDLYTAIYNMCTQKPPHEYSAKLYDKYGETFVEYINSTVLPCLREKHDEFLLREFAKRWSNHKVMVKWLRRFFHYLERYYIVRKARTALNDVGINCFRDLVYQGVRVNVRDAVTTLIHKEREGEQIDRALLKNALGIFVEIGMGHMDYYDIDFEAHLINDTATYYSRKASKWIVEDSCPDYMLKCEECLNKERDRVSHYLHSSSETKLIDAVQHELLVVHSTALLIDKEHSGCMALLRHDKVVDLSRMFRLYCKIPQGLEPIAKMFQQQITAEGTALFQQAEAEDAAANQSSNVAFIWKVIKLHDKYMVYVTDCFKNTSLLHKALKVAFIGFCNKTVCGNSSAELLANFCDTIVLKKGGTEKSSDEAMEVTFEKVVTLLTYIDEKDLFAEFYRKKLAGRLLSDRRLSVDDDLERNILTKLKQQFGAHFTSKMEGMVTDMILARENKSSYEDYLGNNSAAVHPGIDLTVSVLTTGFWPTYKDSDVKLPAEMLKCMQAFQSFYKTKTKSRRLTWLYSQGTCLVNGNFEQKLELVVSTYQAAILLLFNGSDRLSYWEIVEQFNLPHHELARVLHSLSCGRYKILLKEPNTKSVLKSDFFVFNSKFTDRSRRRIKIPLPSIDDEKKKIVENVDNDRRIYIDSAIVRIMKSRKVLGYQQLVAECVEQLSRTFKPDVKAIKKRMEDLIARAYLERDQDNPNMFKYLA